MNDAEVALAQSAIAAAESKAADAIRERDRYKRERDEARALLARYSTSLNEKSNDPASDGKPEAPNA